MSLKDDLIKQLREADTKDNIVFRDMVNKFFELTNMDEYDLAEKIGIIRPIITRWRKGLSAPDKDIRRIIYERLERLLT